MRTLVRWVVETGPPRNGIELVDAPTRAIAVKAAEKVYGKVKHCKRYKAGDLDFADEIGYVLKVESNRPVRKVLGRLTAKEKREVKSFFGEG